MSTQLQNQPDTAQLPPQNEAPPPRGHQDDHDAWSFQIARVAGIPIRLHFTFLLFLIWVGVIGAAHGAAAGMVLFVVGLFACVALHELGHATVGARFGIETASITLYPIGGIARITDRPKPKHELWIALAGPAVNIVIAALIAAYFVQTHHPITWSLSNPAHETLLDLLMRANVIIAVFNLIPAFPMDGGRILRALLAVGGMPPAIATRVAAGIGQFLAIVAGIWAILAGQWILMFIAFFIYIGAGQEAQMVTQQSVLTGVQVSRVMVTQMQSLAPGVTLREVADMILHTSQQDFPIVLGDDVMGLLTREQLLRGLAQSGPDSYVTGSMIREFNQASPNDDLMHVLGEQTRAGRTVGQSLPLLVMENGRMLGMVTSENVAEFFAIQQILSVTQATKRC